MKTAKRLPNIRKNPIDQHAYADIAASNIKGVLAWDGDNDRMSYIDSSGTKVFLPRDATAGEYSAVKTVKVTIGGVGVVGCDFNFVTAANQNEQPIDLGELIPAKARVLDVFTHTDATFTGAVTLVADVGNATGGAQFIASATILTAAEMLQVAVGAGFTLVAITAAASNLWLNATPGANWSLVTAGKMSVYLTYVDVTSL